VAALRFQRLMGGLQSAAFLMHFKPGNPGKRIFKAQHN
jgi:hypothetical protein